MSEPLDQLYREASPTQPRPEFVSALRDQLTDLLTADANAHQNRSAHDTPPTDTEGHHALPHRRPNALTDRSGRRNRWALLAAASAAAVVLVAALMVASGDDDQHVDVLDDPTPTSTARPDPSTTATSSGPVSTTTTTLASDLPPIQTMAAAGATPVKFSARPTFLTYAAGSLFIARQAGEMEQRDADTGALIRSIPISNGAWVLPPVLAHGSVWQATVHDGTLWRIDPTSGAILASISIPNGLDLGPGTAPGVPAPDPAGLWLVASGPTRSLVHIDAETNTVDRTLPVPNPTSAFVSFGFGSLWVGRSDNGVSRVDPADGRELATITRPLVGGNIWPAVAVDAFDGTTAWGWVPDSANRMALIGIDPTDNSVVQAIPLSDVAQDGDGRTFAIDGTTAWATTQDAQLVHIDLQTGTVLARFGPGAATGLTLTPDAVWVTSNSDAMAYRVPRNAGSPPTS